MPVPSHSPPMLTFVVARVSRRMTLNVKPRLTMFSPPSIRRLCRDTTARHFNLQIPQPLLLPRRLLPNLPRSPQQQPHSAITSSVTALAVVLLALSIEVSTT